MYVTDPSRGDTKLNAFLKTHEQTHCKGLDQCAPNSHFMSYSCRYALGFKLMIMLVHTTDNTLSKLIAHLMMTYITKQLPTKPTTNTME